MSLRYTPGRSYRQYVDKLMKCGHWRDAEQTSGGDKGLLTYVADATRTVAYNLHDGGNDWNGPRNLAKEAGDICGCTFIQPRGRKRSRKAADRTDFSILKASRETSEWHALTDGRIESLHADRDAAITALRDLRTQGTRSAVNDAAAHIRTITRCELALAELHQPFDAFSPADLEETA